MWWSVRNFTDADIAKIKDAFRSVNYLWIALSLVISLVSHLLRASLWGQLLEPIAHTPRRINSFGTIMIGYLANLAFPRLGEFTRCAMLSRYENIPLNKTLGTVITERMMDLGILFALTLVSVGLQLQLLGDYCKEYIINPIYNKFHVLFIGKSVSFYEITALVLLICVFFGWLGYRKFKHSPLLQRILNAFRSLFEGVQSVRYVRSIPKLIITNLLIWAAYVMMIYCSTFAMPAVAGVGLKAALACCVFGGFAIATTQGGIGAYQIVVSGLLTLYGVEYQTAYAFSWLVWAAQNILILIVGLLFFIILPLYNKKLPENTDVSAEITPN